MAATVVSSSPTPSSTLPTQAYPFATSPDIIRSNQKDAYSISTLQSTLNDLLRRLYGSRFTHTYTTETETFAHLLYLSLTTLIGNRTLGEEYTDIHQIETSTGSEDHQQRLPAIGKRGGYILLAVLLPYALNKTLPALRRRVRSLLERNLSTGSSPEGKEATTASRRIQTYLLTHLNTITSPSPLHALILTTFYFTGAYYHLSKRLLGLRYIFSKRLSPNEQQARVGYEVLGALLVVQVVVQGIVHARSTLLSFNSASRSRAESQSQQREEKEEKEEEESDNSNRRLQPPVTFTAALDTSSSNTRTRIASTTHTPSPPPSSSSTDPSPVRYTLSNPQTMAWIPPTNPQARKCTLCLEPMRDPSVTTCGHVFCWTCILEWVREKPECPLCRQGVLGQHVLPLRG